MAGVVAANTITASLSYTTYADEESIIAAAEEKSAAGDSSDDTKESSSEENQSEGGAGSENAVGISLSGEDTNSTAGADTYNENDDVESAQDGNANEGSAENSLGDDYAGDSEESVTYDDIAENGCVNVSQEQVENLVAEEVTESLNNVDETVAALLGIEQDNVNAEEEAGSETVSENAAIGSGAENNTVSEETTVSEDITVIDDTSAVEEPAVTSELVTDEAVTEDKVTDSSTANDNESDEETEEEDSEETDNVDSTEEDVEETDDTVSEIKDETDSEATVGSGTGEGLSADTQAAAGESVTGDVVYQATYYDESHIAAVVVGPIYKDEDKISDAASGSYKTGQAYITDSQGKETTTEIIISGLTDENLTNTLETVAYYYNQLDKYCLKMVNKLYVDAEKYCTDTIGFDQNHCWAGTLSNMLWLSGWAKELASEASTSEYAKNYSSNVDRVMEYFQKSFTDDAGEPEEGLNYLMNNEYSFTNYPGVALVKSNAVSSIFSSVVATELGCSFVSLANNLSDLSKLFTSTTDDSGETTISGALVDGAGVAAFLNFIDKDGKVLDGAHYLTTVGLIVDTAATSIKDYFKGIILADTDNDGTLAAGAKSITEVTDEEAYTSKINKQNSYTVYKLNTVTDKNGNEYWEIVNYLGNSTTKAALCGLEILSKCTTDLINKATETEGTKNSSTTADIITEGVNVTLKSDPSTAITTITDKTDATVNLWLNNYSNVSLEREDIPYVVNVCDSDGNVVKSISSTVYFDSLKNYTSSYVQLDVQSLLSGLDYGNYTIQTMFNPDVEGRVTEAFYLNNKFKSLAIKYTKYIEPEEEDTNKGHSHNAPVDIASIPWLDDILKELGLDGIFGVDGLISEDESEMYDMPEDMTESDEAAETADEQASQDAADISEIVTSTGLEGDETSPMSWYYVKSHNVEVSDEKPLDVYIQLPYRNVVALLVDGVRLSEDICCLTEREDGTCKATISNDYLSKLTDGKHTISVSFINEPLPRSFTITISR